MLRLLIVSLLWLGIAQPALAQAMAGCDDSETAIIKDALNGAKGITIKAAVSVADTPEYTRWFGAYSVANAQRVRASLKSVVTAIRGGAVTARCEVVWEDGCAADEFAYVYSDQPYLIYLCPPFFDLPAHEALQLGTRRGDNGSREGTIIHEISHFLHVAATEDHCYSRSECAVMARTSPRQAIQNADSYQYFAEDVTYFARQPVAGKSVTVSGTRP